MQTVTTRAATTRAAAALFLLVGMMPDLEGYAQGTPGPLRPWTGPVPPGVWIQPDSLKPYLQGPDAPLPFHPLLPEAYFGPDADAEKAREAARVDPGILLMPDPALDAKLHVYEPPGAVDPRMILPEGTPRPGVTVPPGATPWRGKKPSW